MASVRTSFQGVINIIRFNWHLYLLPVLLVILLLILQRLLPFSYSFYLNILLAAVLIPTVGSLLVSFFVYDLSGFYKLNWLNGIITTTGRNIVNLHAGFDETSILLHAKYPNAVLTVFDFYDPIKHTEVSVKRARDAYPPYKNTIVINTTSIPLPSESVNHVFLIFAAHEIREDTERTSFFIELNRILVPGGIIIVTEHLRNTANFLAYNIGAFHFFPESVWTATFSEANFVLVRKINFTPFITTFILEKNGNAS